MRHILIIYPHWPPSNLAGVHRPRLIANNLKEFGWQPIILTVDSDYYEEELDFDLCKLVREYVEVYYVKALKVPKPRIFGDIGLRAFIFLYKKALEIIKQRQIDFIWIPIPSFYVSLLGRILYEKTKIPYGIDYIDPWIRDISGRRNLRFILSNVLARFLEPIAVKKASLISGVAFEYYKPVLDRYFKNKTIVHVAMPYGFDEFDYSIFSDSLMVPWSDNEIPIIYAGAFLPLSGYFVDIFFQNIKKLLDKNLLPRNIKFYFLGTGNYKHKSIEYYAERNSLKNFVVEIRKRFGYVQILNLLSRAHGVMVIGSIQKHYTASKIFQALLSKRPVFVVVHYQSTVVDILRHANALEYCVMYNPDETEEVFSNNLREKFLNFFEQKNWKPILKELESFSAKQSAKMLVSAIEQALNFKNK